MIQCSNVAVCLNGMPILTKINVRFSQQDFTCIIGRNGSGKSTLLRAIAGLASYEGSIRLCGQEAQNMNRQTCAKLLAFLPQHRPVPETDTYTLIAHGRYPHMGFSKALSAADREQIEMAAHMTGVENLLDRDVASLSGGERQRVYLAMTVAQDAKLILLDEPATYLDVEHQLQMMGLLCRLHEMGKGIVMAAHDLEQAFHYATRVCLMNKGSIAAAGLPPTLCENAVLEEAMGVSVQPSVCQESIYTYRLARRKNS